MYSCSQIVTTNKPTPSFIQAGCLSCCPISSAGALKGKRQSLQALKIDVIDFTVCFNSFSFVKVAPKSLLCLSTDLVASNKIKMACSEISNTEHYGKFDACYRRRGFDNLSLDKFRCVAVLGRGHFGKVSYLEIMTV